MQSSEQLNNAGWFDAHIDVIEITAPNFRLVRATGAGMTIAPGQTKAIAVWVRVLDCSKVTRRTGVPIELRLHRFWGEKTLTIGTFESSWLPWASCHGA